MKMKRVKSAILKPLLPRSCSVLNPTSLCVWSRKKMAHLVDMRSNSRWGPHDLGSNADRILSFMKDLDLALQGAGHGG